MPRRRFLRRFAAFTRSLTELFISPSKTVMCSFTLAVRSSGWGAQRLMIISAICRQMSSTKPEIAEPIRMPVRSRSGSLSGPIRAPVWSRSGRLFGADPEACQEPIRAPVWIDSPAGSNLGGTEWWICEFRLSTQSEGRSFFALYFLSGCWAHACLIRGSGPSSPAFVAAFPEPLELLQVLIYSD